MSDVVTLARRWIGTPYRHQGAVKGAGCDCLGLIRGIWTELCGSVPEVPPPYTPDWAEPQRHEVLWAAALRHLSPLPPGEPGRGDVLLFRMRPGSVAKHLGLAAETGETPSFIHSYSEHGVVESPLSLPWRRRIVARFAFPERAH
ncbi:MAG: peptidase [Limimaricola sp.]|uniref:NlpC/P60 family protein n=1 Tax=Limimaricola sp. TaxID=2211665 RepID=UPI001DA06739|nr:NlpC/P60 family protein [Limimaricola sp.]MBI1416691.1 peptidase [Limimaricola sp.]